MTIAQLLEELKKYSLDTEVVVDGYESGQDDLEVKNIERNKTI